MRHPLVLLSVYAALVIWSALGVQDHLTWFLEVSPVWVGLVVIAITWKRFPLSAPSLWLILLFVAILCVGGKYTYPRVPLFDWIRDLTHGTRNNYDKFGHFWQGFMPAFVAREVLIRKNAIPDRTWRNFFVVCFCISLSTAYEWAEWWIASGIGVDADSFLGTQGYVWDTQSDMFMAFLGALGALPFEAFHRRHILSVARIPA